MKRIVVLTLLGLLSLAADALAQKDLAKERVSLAFKRTPVGQSFAPWPARWATNWRSIPRSARS